MKAESLASRANSGLNRALSAVNQPAAPTFSIWGINRNSYTGDIQLYLDNQTLLGAILALPDAAWTADINPALSLRRKILPVIVHGIPTTFDTENRHHTHALITENNGVLDSATKIQWANKFLIQAGKPFSSTIIHLTDPVAANQAICNCICFKHLRKVTERLTKRVKQCYQCPDYGHFLKSCPVDFQACSHRADSHAYDSCTKLAEPLCCVHCAQNSLKLPTQVLNRSPSPGSHLSSVKAEFTLLSLTHAQFFEPRQLRWPQSVTILTLIPISSHTTLNSLPAENNLHVLQLNTRRSISVIQSLLQNPLTLTLHFLLLQEPYIYPHSNLPINHTSWTLFFPDSSTYPTDTRPEDSTIKSRIYANQSIPTTTLTTTPTISNCITTV